MSDTIKNPLTKRQVKVGRRVWKRLVRSGVVTAQEPDNEWSIRLLERALRGYTRSYAVEVVHDTDISQLSLSRTTISNLLKRELRETHGMKVVETVKVTFEKTLERDLMTRKTAYFNSKTSSMSVTSRVLFNVVQNNSRHVVLSGCLRGLGY